MSYEKTLQNLNIFIVPREKVNIFQRVAWQAVAEDEKNAIFRFIYLWISYLEKNSGTEVAGESNQCLQNRFQI